ncbi:MAG: DUF123 domain-containing protein [Chlorobi bacterium]|nr:DUF123 domain-containing protein [Chlorobiota bacterium]
MKKAQKITDITSGIYLIEFFASKNFFAGIPRYQKVEFPKGYYYYAGSAQRNFSSRILRHVKKAKKVHWHIDHITTHADIEIKTIFLFPNRGRADECRLAQTLEKDFGLIHKAKGFGSSDCNSCYSHFLYSKKNISYSHLFSLYQDIVRFSPSSKEIF